MPEELYYHEFMQEIFARSGAESDFNETVFTEKVAEFLIDQAIIDECIYIGFKKESMGIKLDAWTFNEELERLTLIITDFRHSATPESLTAQEIKKSFRRAEKYFLESAEKGFDEKLEESIPAYQLSRFIREKKDSISSLHFILISNAVLSSRVESFSESEILERNTSYDIWEISRFERIESAGKEREETVINFAEYGDNGGIPCLPASLSDDHFESYLLVMPGDVLAALYEKYGERLLEQNVRTFLQFRGKVNKGIRNTIIHEAEMFFPYNNGLSATAERVGTNDSRTTLESAVNLQIVNGGQTTASIFNAWKKDKADLSKVFVQVKLTVIDPDHVEIVVPKISEFANTQNKVSASDFFSNHPFHLRIEEFSRRLWAPSPAGSLRETRWFYERARGQYANAQINLTVAQRKQFQAINPRAQMFTKTDLAKFEHTLEMKPHIVSRGAQKNFSEFAGKIGSNWEKHETRFNELYFQHFISKAILFRYLDRNIMKQSWYGGYKANIVTYTLAKFAYMIKEIGLRIDLDKIWNEQKLSDVIEIELLELASEVNAEIQKTPEGITNVTEWCKKPACWDQVKKMRFELSSELRSELSNLEDTIVQKRDAEVVQKIQSGIQMQTYVIEKGEQYWKHLACWARENQQFSITEMSILESAFDLFKKIPSEKQCKIIIRLEERGIEEGYYPKESEK